MQFQVPQFIETEDKIIGPLTLTQFLYIGVAAGIVAVLFFILNFGLWIATTIFFGSIGVGLAFGKMNGRPITIYLSALIDSIWKPRVYVYKPSFPTHMEERVTARRAKAVRQEHKLKQPEMDYVEKTAKQPEPEISTTPQLKTTEKTNIVNIRKPKRRHRLSTPSFGGVQGLREWLATSKTAIPRREKPLPKNFGRPQKEFKNRYSIIRHFTGERELAKRIDYR